MRIILTILLAVFFQPLLAATYQWEGRVVNGAVGGIEDLGSPSFYGYVFEGAILHTTAWINGDMITYKDGAGVYIKQGDQKTTPMPADVATWYLALYGDVISENRVDATMVPLCVFADYTKEGGIEISSPEDFYLAFVSPASSSLDGLTRYGWMHLSMDVNDSELWITVLDSGVGLYGEGVIVGVGPVPEPSRTLLLLLGVGLLGLRRRRGIRN